jgi:large subunit ribosomal protein L13
MSKTFMAKPNEIQPKWWLVDASNKIVGRLASDIAVILMGKHRPTYTPHVDTGDYVVVTNVDQITFSGKKLRQKQYTRYTGYPRLRVELASERLEKTPEIVLSEAVRRMLPKNKLGKKMLTKLKCYKSNEQHPHQAQNPEKLELAAK